VADQQESTEQGSGEAKSTAELKGDGALELSEEEKKHLLVALLEQSKGFATAVLLVAGAALSLSVTVFAKIAADSVEPLNSLGWLKASWVFFAATMLAQVFTILTSIHAIRSTLRTGVYATRWGRVTEFLNWAIGVALALGTLCLVVFSWQNVGGAMAAKKTELVTGKDLRPKKGTGEVTLSYVPTKPGGGKGGGGSSGGGGAAAGGKGGKGK